MGDPWVNGVRRVHEQVIISAVTWAWTVVLLLLLGLPAAAVWWSRRAAWSRLRPGRDRDVLGDVRRTHGLTPVAMGRLEAALLGGHALQDPAERAAVVALARAWEPAPPHGRRRTALLVAAAAWLALLGAGAVVVAVQSRWDDVPWWALVWALPFWWTGRRTRRAVRLNTD